MNRFILCSLITFNCAAMLSAEQHGRSGPAKLNELVSLNIDFSGDAAQKRNEALSEITTLMSKVSKSKHAELTFRMAELIWEQSRYYFAKEFEKYERAYSTWESLDRKGTEPKLSQFVGESDKLHKKSIELYRAILNNNKDYERIDEVIFLLGYLEYEQGNKTTGIEYYKRLIAHYPQSDFIADAYLAVGEHYFDDKNISAARDHYQQAYNYGIKSYKSSVFMFALYKLAWCDFNTSNFIAARNRFHLIIDKAHEISKNAQQYQHIMKDTLRLQRESMIDLVRVYSNLGAVKEAYDYFVSKIGKDESLDYIAKLAKEYNAHGDYLREVQTNDILLTEYPQNAFTPRLLSSSLIAYAKLNQRAQVEVYTDKIIAWCGVEKNDEVIKQQSAELTSSCALAEQRMRELAIEFHGYAQKQYFKDDYEMAEKLYLSYVKAFPNSPEIARIQFFIGEVYWDLGLWQQAAHWYQASVEKDAASTFALAAAYNAVLSWEKVVNKEPTVAFEKGRMIVQKKKTGITVEKTKELTVKKEDLKAITTPTLIPQEKLQLAKSYDDYLRLLKNKKADKEQLKEFQLISFKAALIFYTHGHYEEANKRFDGIMFMWPTSQYAQLAAQLIVEEYNASKDWASMLRSAQAILSNKILAADAAFQKKIRVMEEGAAYNIVLTQHEAFNAMQSSAQSKDKMIPIAQKYDGFVIAYPTSLFAVKALYNAMELYRAADRLDKAKQAAAHIVEDHKDDTQLVAQALYALALMCEATGEYKRAAQLYGRYAEKYTPELKNALFNVAVLNYYLNADNESIRLFTAYLKKEDNEQNRVKALQILGEIYSAQEKNKEAVDVYKQMHALKSLPIDDKIFADLAIAKIYFNASDYSQALVWCKEIGDVVALQKKNLSDAAKHARAYCEYEAGRALWENYRSVSLNASYDKVAKLIKLKREKMRAAVAHYVAILSYGDAEWGIAGLLRAAEVQLDYVNALRGIKSPPRLDADAQAVFRSELENIVFPVQEDAITALKEAQKKAFELNIYSASTKRIYKLLETFESQQQQATKSLPLYLEQQEVVSAHG